MNVTVEKVCLSRLVCDSLKKLFQGGEGMVPGASYLTFGCLLSSFIKWDSNSVGSGLLCRTKQASTCGTLRAMLVTWGSRLGGKPP